MTEIPSKIIFFSSKNITFIFSKVWSPHKLQSNGQKISKGEHMFYPFDHLFSGTHTKKLKHIFLSTSF